MTDCEGAALSNSGGEDLRLTYRRTDKLTAQVLRGAAPDRNAAQGPLTLFARLDSTLPDTFIWLGRGCQRVSKRGLMPSNRARRSQRPAGRSGPTPRRCLVKFRCFRQVLAHLPRRFQGSLLCSRSCCAQEGMDSAQGGLPVGQYPLPILLIEPEVERLRRHNGQALIGLKPCPPSKASRSSKNALSSCIPATPIDEIIVSG